MYIKSGIIIYVTTIGFVDTNICLVCKLKKKSMVLNKPLGLGMKRCIMTSSILGLSQASVIILFSSINIETSLCMLWFI